MDSQLYPSHICVVGLGYVGLSLAMLLASAHRVIAVDIDQAKIDALKEQRSPISDTLIEAQLQKKALDIHFTSRMSDQAYQSDYLIIATPTNYDPDTNQFDTTRVESVIQAAHEARYRGCIVIKSTIPVGFTTAMQAQYPELEIIFSPEFLREGHALADNLAPSRIIIGGDSDRAQQFGSILASAATNAPKVLQTQATEAEAIKLFANTYLAMRVAFFNELDSYCEHYSLSSRAVLEGVGLDPRIGQHYNNPSFGYGGYCLPKDTKQMAANFADVPNDIIKAIVSANDTRKDFVATSILNRSRGTIGIYRLAMKKDSDNFRDSAILSIIERLADHVDQIIIYEPSLQQTHFNDYPVANDLHSFAEQADLIVANRLEPVLMAYADKVYSRDIFEVDT